MLLLLLLQAAACPCLPAFLPCTPFHAVHLRSSLFLVAVRATSSTTFRSNLSNDWSKTLFVIKVYVSTFWTQSGHEQHERIISGSKVVDGWRSGHSICCFDLNFHAPPQRWVLQIINLIKVYDSISSTQRELVAGDLVTPTLVASKYWSQQGLWFDILNAE